MTIFEKIMILIGVTVIILLMSVCLNLFNNHKKLKHSLVFILISIFINIIILSFLLFEKSDLDVITKIVLPLDAIIIPLGFAYFNTMENNLRKEKALYYSKLIEAVTNKASCLTITPDDEVNFCNEINKLSLYATKEVIAIFKNTIDNGKDLNTKKLLECIRNDLVNPQFEVIKNDDLFFRLADKKVFDEVNKNDQN
jgi:predicted negative regulator of RcsB-dependent stress response